MNNDETLLSVLSEAAKANVTGIYPLAEMRKMLVIGISELASSETDDEALTNYLAVAVILVAIANEPDFADQGDATTIENLAMLWFKLEDARLKKKFTEADMITKAKQIS